MKLQNMKRIGGMGKLSIGRTPKLRHYKWVNYNEFVGEVRLREEGKEHQNVNNNNWMGKRRSTFASVVEIPGRLPHMGDCGRV